MSKLNKVSPNASLSNNFTTEQQATIAAAMADPRAFVTRRVIEAIVASDKDRHNDCLLKMLDQAPSRMADLVKMLLATQKDQGGDGKRSLAEFAKATEPVPIPLKIQG